MSQTDPSKTSSLPAAAPGGTTKNGSGLQVCSISEPICTISTEPVVPKPNGSVPNTMTIVTLTPSTQRKFVVADVEESDSPDELSAPGSTENLESEAPPTSQQEPQTDTPSDSSVSTHHAVPEMSSGGDGGSEVLSGDPDSTGQREDTTRPHLLSAPSYSAPLVPEDMLRQRSSSLPQRLSSLHSTSSEKLSVTSPLPPISERSAMLETSDVFTSDPVTSTATHPPHPKAHTTSQPQIHPSHPSHPLHPHTSNPHSIRHSPSPQPHPLPHLQPHSSNPFAAIPLQQSELLSNAFMYFVFTMSRALKDPAIQPLIHHLENHFGGNSPPPSPTVRAPPDVGVHEDDDLKKEMDR